MIKEKIIAALPFCARIALGLVLLIAGIKNMFFGTSLQIQNILPFLLPGTGLYLIGLAELIIGLLLVLGLFTRFAGWAAAIWFFLGLILTPFLGVGFRPVYLVLIVIALQQAFGGCTGKGLDAVFVKKKG